MTIKPSRTSKVVREYQACPELPGEAVHRNHRARQEMAQLVEDIHECDPRQIWGRLNMIGNEDPALLLAITVTALAAVDITARPKQWFEWTETFGGTARLHPDFDRSANTYTPMLPEERDIFDDEVERLVAMGYTSMEIARRTGRHERTVQRARARLKKRRDESEAA